MGLIKVTPQDKIFSRLIRERDNWTCTHCGKTYPEGQRRGLHCSHFYSRAAKSIRWHPLNADAHCWGCHQFLEGRPALFVQWKEHRLGDKSYGWLLKAYNTIVPWKKTDLKELTKELQQIQTWMDYERARGNTKPLDFNVKIVDEMLQLNMK